MKLDGIVFDKDGTLFDFEASWSGWLAAVVADLSRGDGAVAGDLARRLGFSLETRRFAPESLVIAGSLDEVIDAMLPLLPGLSEDALGPLSKRLVAQSAEIAMVPVVPLRPVLCGLAGRGLRLGVATNDAEAAARAHLDAAGIADLFPYVAGYDSGFGAKPAPGMCLGFAQGHGLDPARVAMVGDSTHDLRAGRAAGMVTVAVLSGLAERDVLAPLADVVLPDIGHLGAWLEM